MERKLYNICLEGCDDSTEFPIMLTEEEYEVIKRVSDKANEISSYRCEPRMYIWEDGVSFGEAYPDA